MHVTFHLCHPYWYQPVRLLFFQWEVLVLCLSSVMQEPGECLGMKVDKFCVWRGTTGILVHWPPSPSAVERILWEGLMVESTIGFAGLPWGKYNHLCAIVGALHQPMTPPLECVARRMKQPQRRPATKLGRLIHVEPETT